MFIFCKKKWKKKIVTLDKKIDFFPTSSYFAFDTGRTRSSANLSLRSLCSFRTNLFRDSFSPYSDSLGSFARYHWTTIIRSLFQI